MIGLEQDLPEGYRGFVFHRGASSIDQAYYNPGAAKVILSSVGEFSKSTEWRKDQWVAQEETYAGSLRNYLECSAILNAEE